MNQNAKGVAKTLKQVNAFINYDGQFIRRESFSGVGKLPYSAMFRSAGVEWTFNGGSALLTAGDWYTARVTLPRLKQLEMSTSVAGAKEILLNNLRIADVVRDQQVEEYQEAVKTLKTHLHLQVVNKGLTRQHLVAISEYTIRYLSTINGHCVRVSEDSKMPKLLKTAIANVFDKRQPLQDRNLLMRDKDGFNCDFEPLAPFFHKTIQQGCTAYRKRLLADCPGLLREKLENASDGVVLNVTLGDLALFTELEKLLDDSKFTKLHALTIITQKYWAAVTGLLKWTPSTSSAYLPLLEGLLSTAEDVCTATSLEVLVYEYEWKLRGLPDTISNYGVQQFVQKLKLLVELTNHYEPGKSTVAQKFAYGVKLLVTSDVAEVSKTVRLDVVRMLAMVRKESQHEMVRFIVETLPWMGNLTQKDAGILQKQMYTKEPGLLRVFSNYWKLRQSFFTNLVTRLPGNHWKSKAPELMRLFLQTTTNLMEGIAPTDSDLFLRVIDGMWAILRELRFDWYVEAPDEEIFVTNELISSSPHGAQGHLVLDPDAFLDQYRLSFPNSPDPKHYEVLRLEALLSCVHMLTVKTTGDERKRILSTVLLLTRTIRKTLFRLRLIDCSMKKLDDISTIPFKCMVGDFMTNPDKSLDDVRIWLERSGELVYSTPKVELTPGNALDTVQLIQQYYADEFDEYIVKATNNFTASTGFLKVLDLYSTGNLHITASTWYTGAFYMNWDYLYQYPLPTAGQFCSVLELLNSIKPPGVETPIYLVDLLPEQEKSLLLGLSALVLAHCGHQVFIIGPSKYLIERNARRYGPLCPAIFVSTYGEMMMECYFSLLLQAEAYLRKAMDLGAHETAGPATAFDMTNSVLLIDEVDAYFSGQFSDLPMHLQLQIPGLDAVQCEIWRIVTSEDLKNDVIVDQIDSFVQEGDQPSMQELRHFLGKPSKYNVYDPACGSKLVTNEELYRIHLEQMIHAAKLVHTGGYAKLFYLDSDGLLTGINDLELARQTISPYLETFAYFELKQKDFIHHVQAGYNYGYFCILAGNLSYGKLLRNYKAVVGVTGVDMDRSDEQLAAMKSLYSVQANFPTLSADFGQPAEFKYEPNFLCSPTEDVWRNLIFCRATMIVNQGRSVIVFFDHVSQIREFTKEYGSRLKIFNVLTVATVGETRTRILADAGMPWMTTLTTRDMARGIDFNSSLTVEEIGGIHVLQTFFSLDNYEEKQIRNRVARKPNREPFEMIVCLEHLRKLGLARDGEKANEGDVWYELLDERRQPWAEERYNTMEDANRKHDEVEAFYQTD